MDWGINNVELNQLGNGELYKYLGQDEEIGLHEVFQKKKE